MKIYISGITGTGLGPLALMAKAAGFEVCGSDQNRGAIYDELTRAGIEVFIGEQDGAFLESKLNEIDWFVYTSALPKDHAELMMAKKAGVRCTKRDDLTAFLVDKLGLKMVAVAGTHGKTTTTAMIVWTALRLKIPVSYLVGTTFKFAPSGAYHPGDKFFVYEADEYDRNFLKYHPWLSVITVVDYDHPDIYPTVQDYNVAFEQFKKQSERVIDVPSVTANAFKLAGEKRQYDAALAASALKVMAPEISSRQIVEILNEFPGANRRFERLTDGIYSDYAHHPTEIRATIDVAEDERRVIGAKGVVVVYQPHQNARQYEVYKNYVGAFEKADKVLWLPTYLVREDPGLAVLTPEELSAGISGVEIFEMNDALYQRITELKKAGYLVVLMTAGPADEWLRKKLAI